MGSIHGAQPAPGLAKATVPLGEKPGTAPVSGVRLCDADTWAARLVSEAMVGFSPEALARTLGVSRALVRHWMTPEHPASPNLRHLCALPANALRAVVDGLLARLEPTEAEIPPESLELEALRLDVRARQLGAIAERAAVDGWSHEHLTALVRAQRDLARHGRRLERSALAALGRARAAERGAR